MKKEIVFSPTVQGALKVAQYTGIGDYPQSWLLSDEKMGLPKEQIEKHNKEQMEKWYNSRPIGGRSQDILCFEYRLAFGDISEKTPSSRRYESIYKMISTMYNPERSEKIAEDWVKDIKKKNAKYLKELKSAIKNEDSLRIWYSSFPDEINAFYWIMSFLDSQKYYKNVSAVYIAPDYFQRSCYYRGTGMLGSEMFFEALNFEKTISEDQIKVSSERWEKLRKENAPIRLMVSGNLVSLPEDFLDSFIYSTIAKMPKSFTIAKLVGNVMGEYELMVGDMPLFARVLHMIEKGDLVLTEEWDNKNPMHTKVKR